MIIRGVIIMSKKQVKTKIAQLVKDIKRAEEFLKKHFQTDWAKVITINNEIFHKNEIGYGVVVIQRRVRGRKRKDYVVGLVRFNIRMLTIISLVPIEKEVLNELFETIKEAWNEADRRNLEIKKQEAKKKFEKVLSKFDEEERKLLLELLSEKK